jgi:hypothetical protein
MMIPWVENALTVLVHSWHLCRFSTNQGTASLLAALCDTLDDVRGRSHV